MGCCKCGKSWAKVEGNKVICECGYSEEVKQTRVHIPKGTWEQDIPSFISQIRKSGQGGWLEFYEDR